MRNRLLLLVVYTFPHYAATTHSPAEKIQPNEIGNLTLPASQQPNPLFGFGQNVVNKGDLQAILTVDRIKGKHKRYSEVIPAVLYGISDSFSLFVYQPIAHFSRCCNRSSGLEDAFIQLEYAFYNYVQPNYFIQATVVGSLVLPIGSSKKQPPTGFGSPSFFLGGTCSYNATDWYIFGSAGTLLTTAHHGTKFGSIFLYQGGVGKI